MKAKQRVSEFPHGGKGTHLAPKPHGRRKHHSRIKVSVRAGGDTDESISGLLNLKNNVEQTETAESLQAVPRRGPTTNRHTIHDSITKNKNQQSRAKEERGNEAIRLHKVYTAC